MFRRLRVKLTVLYAGLFCIALMLIGATAYVVINDNTQRLARQQLASAAEAFDRISALRIEGLRDNVANAARTETLHVAVEARDVGAIQVALDQLRARARADLVFLITREGLIIGETGGAGTSVSPGLQAALSREASPAGVMRIGGVLHQAATAPLPNGMGWLVAGASLDSDEMAALERMSPLPIAAAVLPRNDAGWGGAIAPDERAARDVFIDHALNSEDNHAGRLDAPSGDALALVRALPSLDGARSVLMLRFPLSSALSPYRALFGTLFAIGLAGVALLVACTWFLARSITQPLSTLEAAARNLQQGVYDNVAVRTHDELGRLAQSFNAMIGAIRERERKITQLAYHDVETRLPNRLALERRLSNAAQSDRLYLAAIGVDRFAHMRGAIGYALAADAMRTLGGRLLRVAPNAPTARLSSDILAVAFLADNDAHARKRADTLISSLEQPLALGDQALDVNVVVGIAQPRAKNETPAALIERASVALDQARAARAKQSFFDKSAYGDPARNLSLMGEMRHALESGDMQLVHQPKYDFHSGRIHGAECLVRWKHPSRGMIAPDLFVPMAEETGHIRALTEWVLRTAIIDQKALSAAGWPLMLSVNISARLLSDDDFTNAALGYVRQAPHGLCFEITETAIIDNPKAALENIEKFAANGVRISIDDYGSGLSSLAYLKQLPAHELKIDKLFIQNLTANQRDALLVRSTIDLAHGLGLAVTAEGVETPAAFALLAGMNCDLAQGYLVARPAPASDLVAILNDERRLRFYQQTAAAGAGDRKAG